MNNMQLYSVSENLTIQNLNTTTFHITVKEKGKGNVLDVAWVRWK